MSKYLSPVLEAKKSQITYNLTVICYRDHIYYLDIDTKYWTLKVILAQLLFVRKKRIRQMSTYMSVPRAILMTSFFSHRIYLIYRSINIHIWEYEISHTHTCIPTFNIHYALSFFIFLSHTLFVSLHLWQEISFVICNVHFERYYFFQ